jgi:hypothetical protein
MADAKTQRIEVALEDLEVGGVAAGQALERV